MKANVCHGVMIMHGDVVAFSQSVLFQVVGVDELLPALTTQVLSVIEVQGEVSLQVVLSMKPTIAWLTDVLEYLVVYAAMMSGYGVPRFYIFFTQITVILRRIRVVYCVYVTL